MMSMLSAVAGVSAIAFGLLPIRALGLVVAPMMLFLGACLQARGYLYQVTPVIGSTNILCITLLSSLWHQSTGPRWPSRRGPLAAAALTFVAYNCLDNLHKSPYRWNGEKGAWSHSSHEFATIEKQVGEYLRLHTKPTDTVFSYSSGENAHFVLFYARRRTASPFFHSFWLDPVGLLPQSEIKPDERELAILESLQTKIRDQACGAIQRSPPAAMAFNLLEQVFKVCPNVKIMLEEEYQEETTIGGYHVYMRKAPS
jgi:hypothetical protein